MNLRRWMLLYLLAGPSLTRWAILAYYGGGLFVLVLVVSAALFSVTGTVPVLFP
ncbi:MAG: hypothetical protein KJZ78_06890 [Bryobacteraceae bacterium]|nr:hypothetical protein [Bryobacteraceae bacterium]